MVSELSGGERAALVLDTDSLRSAPAHVAYEDDDKGAQ